MLVLADSINRVTERLEVALNIAASVPFFGILGTAAKISMLKVQIVAGAVFTGFGVVQFGIAKYLDDEEEALEARVFIQFGLEYTGHGILNAGKACMEIISFMTTMCFGTLWYNLSGEKGEAFEPKFKYSEYSGNPYYILA